MASSGSASAGCEVVHHPGCQNSTVTGLTPETSAAGRDGSTPREQVEELVLLQLFKTCKRTTLHNLVECRHKEQYYETCYSKCSLVQREINSAERHRSDQHHEYSHLYSGGAALDLTSWTLTDEGQTLTDPDRRGPDPEDRTLTDEDRTLTDEGSDPDRRGPDPDRRGPDPDRRGLDPDRRGFTNTRTHRVSRHVISKNKSNVMKELLEQLKQHIDIETFHQMKRRQSLHLFAVRVKVVVMRETSSRLWTSRDLTSAVDNFGSPSISVRRDAAARSVGTSSMEERRVQLHQASVSISVRSSAAPPPPELRRADKSAETLRAQRLFIATTEMGVIGLRCSSDTSSAADPLLDVDSSPTTRHCGHRSKVRCEGASYNVSSNREGRAADRRVQTKTPSSDKTLHPVDVQAAEENA
ncbi:hypothetical protein F2P81_024615 [Scophthalmus maximus]|uniref:Uncharacterized protein n=1 Tax=Scophthalmus maximus TaxID=52904 RepID=A0A6A4RUS7_SCOMX|nr:hypothetical protein F2P81_024615 [Scophthalmus maximus]